MGQARDRLTRDAQMLAFDFHAPKCYITLGDRRALAGDEARDDLVVPRAVRHCAVSLIAAAFPQGVDRHDGRIWAAWLESFDDEAPIVDLTRGQLEWLRKHVVSDTVKVPPALAQWREALANYLDALLDTPAPTAPEPPAE